MITLAVGDTFLAKLPGKESPGSGWVVTPGDPRVVDVASHSDDGETQAFTLVAKGAGKTRLVFAYRHPHENREPIKTVTMDVQVAGGWLARNWQAMFGAGVVAGVAGGIVHAHRKKKKK